MYWAEHLTQKERDEMLAGLSSEQRTFINEHLKRGRRTVFANILAREKASIVDEENIERVAAQWVLLDYIDAGPDWQKSSKLYCECGRLLRYQYIVQNKATGEVREFGIKHLEDHIGIPPHLVKDIVKGIEAIDFEMDEILLKISNGWTLEDEGITIIPPTIDIPTDIQQHLEYHMPLLARQVRRLQRRIQEYLREEKRQKLEALRAKHEQQAQKQMEIAAQRKKEVAAKMGWGKRVESNDFQLEESLQLGVFVFLESLETTEFRASEVCQYLVANHGASNETYPSGKFHIFPNVCMFLEYLTTQGKVALVEKQGVNDRIYRIVDI